MKQNTPPCCLLCGSLDKVSEKSGSLLCGRCQYTLERAEKHPEVLHSLLQQGKDAPPQAKPAIELPDVLDGKRYRTIDRDNNKWYLSISEVDNQPVEVFASTAFDRDHELQSRISNLTTITRLISLILRHIFLSETITMEKCLKQIKRSSRNKNDLPDMLYRILSQYHNKV